MVLERGTLVEYDSPFALLNDTSSKFHALCRATGEVEFAYLRQTAEAAAEKKKKESL